MLFRIRLSLLWLWNWFGAAGCIDLHLADLVSTQSVAGVNANANDITSLNVRRRHRRQGFIHKVRITVA